VSPYGHGKSEYQDKDNIIQSPTACQQPWPTVSPQFRGAAVWIMSPIRLEKNESFRVTAPCVSLAWDRELDYSIASLYVLLRAISPGLITRGSTCASILLTVGFSRQAALQCAFLF